MRDVTVVNVIFSAVDESFQIIDESVKDDILRFPTHELVSMLFPGHKIGRKGGIMRSPFRNDRNPSFSCFKGRGGYSFWKDHATDESGDNISLFRKVFPELGYVDAVDRLSLMLFGRSALNDHAGRVRREVRAVQAKRASYVRTLEPERESVLKIISDLPVRHESTPSFLVDYWRSRGISDITMTALGCRYIVFENTNRKGMSLMDPVSGLPLVDSDGYPLKDDGRNDAIGLYNDLGGVVFRVPDTPSHRGFKGGTSSFITTVLADGSRHAGSVYFGGEGNNAVAFVRYDVSCRALQINPSQAFVGVSPESAVSAVQFCHEYIGQTLDLRDVKCICAVLCSLNSPVSDKVAVVEGMFDGLSEREITRMRGTGGEARDLVILNSISNIRWAVPFICRHTEATLMLDNDISSGAGRKAFVQLVNEVRQFGLMCGTNTVVFDGSVIFENFKDLNEALMAGKSFPVKSAHDNRRGPRKPGITRI